MQTLFACDVTISLGMGIMKLLQKRCVCSIICMVLWLFIYFKEYFTPENRVAIWWFCYGRHQKDFRSAKQYRNKARNDIRAVCSKLSGEWPVRVHGAYRRHVGKPACRPEIIVQFCLFYYTELATEHRNWGAMLSSRASCMHLSQDA